MYVMYQKVLKIPICLRQSYLDDNQLGFRCLKNLMHWLALISLVIGIVDKLRLFAGKYAFREMTQSAHKFELSYGDGPFASES